MTIGEQPLINVQLTADEILYLRKCAVFPGGYQWEKEIADSALDKLTAVYPKPTMTREEYQHRLDEYREYWLKVPDGLYVVDMMVKAEERQLEFYYEIVDKGGDGDA